MADEIDAFITKSGVSPDTRGVLGSFIEFLKSRGQFVPNGDLKKQFIEKTTVKDKAGKSIDVESCLVCGHAEYEVKG